MLQDKLLVKGLLKKELAKNNVPLHRQTSYLNIFTLNSSVKQWYTKFFKYPLKAKHKHHDLAKHTVSIKTEWDSGITLTNHSTKSQHMVHKWFIKL